MMRHPGSQRLACAPRANTVRAHSAERKPRGKLVPVPFPGLKMRSRKKKSTFHFRGINFNKSLEINAVRGRFLLSFVCSNEVCKSKRVDKVLRSLAWIMRLRALHGDR